MRTQPQDRLTDDPRVLLGNEAVALAAAHAGISAAYAYPGTPSTEILQFLLDRRAGDGNIRAAWATNEKSAYEAALGVSMVGGRVLVAMKHVGLNVAADPFINSALVAIHGGLVLAVADDPGMHSSQNEQDTRFYTDFAHVPCFEPADQQEAYDMTREAFAVSERFGVPVVVRLVTRLAHSRSAIRVDEPLEPRRLGKPPEPNSWNLLPAFARLRWAKLLARVPDMEAYTESTPFNVPGIPGDGSGFGVITAGVARNYFLETVGSRTGRPAHLHVGVYPIPRAAIRRFAENLDTILVLEDGYPFIEECLKGVLSQRVEIRGRLAGQIPPSGELTPEIVGAALGAAGTGTTPEDVPVRPPRLCDGCPHRDAFTALNRVTGDHRTSLVASDIGCYTLGALPPFSAIESCVCMGASIGMAKGAADAGFGSVFAVIGDSTFLHSGIPPLLDAVEADSDMTVLVLDNRVVAMTGAQPTATPPTDLEGLILGLGVDPGHFHVVDSHPKHVDRLAGLIEQEAAHHGLSVLVIRRECLESIRRKKSRAVKEGAES
jgi:indolepyruvate ferredoxin oxidoreductase alpha subunit